MTNTPVFLLITSQKEEAQALAQKVKKLCPGNHFHILPFLIEDWGRDLSPWEASTAQGGRFPGGGLDTLWRLVNNTLPQIRRDHPDAPVFLVGYSLAGLSALWSLYEVDGFDGAACCSGSLWYDGWAQFAAEHTLRQPGAVYLSLGGKEERSPIPLLASVGDRTRQQERILKKDTNCTAVTLEWNPGGHYADPIARMAKGIRWLMQEHNTLSNRKDDTI